VKFCSIYILRFSWQWLFKVTSFALWHCSHIGGYSSMFLQNVTIYLQDYMVSQPGRPQFNFARLAGSSQSLDPDQSTGLKMNLKLWGKCLCSQCSQRK
jgi:hypothetical protein